MMRSSNDWLPERIWSGHRMAAAAGFLVVLAYPLFFFRLADRDVYSSHEGRAGQNAQSILDDGSWDLPHLFDLHPELQKPPLYYWLVAFIARIQGGRVNEWSVRLPAAIAGLGGMILLFFWCATRGRPLAGFIAALVLGTSMHYTWLARVGRIDLPLMATGMCALLAFANAFSGVSGRRVRWLSGAYVMLGVSVLFKGPVGFVLPAMVMAGWVLLRRWPPQGCPTIAVRSLGLWWGIPLSAMIFAPWFFWANWKTHGELFQTFFIYHNWQRAMGGGELRSHPWWFYFPRLGADFMPWTPFLALAFAIIMKNLRRDAEAAFGSIWLVMMFVFLSCVRFKRADYLAPAYPGAALMIGCVFERCFSAIARPAVRIAGIAGIAVSAAIFWVIYTADVLSKLEPSLEQRRFAKAIREIVPVPNLVLFFRAESHALAFHLGAPLDTFLEWENLNVWAGRPGSYYIVMPPECVEESRDHLTAGRLAVVIWNTDFPGAGKHERPLVLVRTCPNEQLIRDEQHQSLTHASSRSKSQNTGDCSDDE